MCDDRNSKRNFEILELEILLFNLAHNIVHDLLSIAILQDALTNRAEATIFRDLSRDIRIKLTPVRLSVDLQVDCL